MCAPYIHESPGKFEQKEKKKKKNRVSFSNRIIKIACTFSAGAKKKGKSERLVEKVFCSELDSLPDLDKVIYSKEENK